MTQVKAGTTWTPPETATCDAGFAERALVGPIPSALGGDFTVPFACLWCSGSCGHSLAIEPSPSLHIIGHVRHGDGRSGPFDADGADEEPHPVLMLRKDMLDTV